MQRWSLDFVSDQLDQQSLQGGEPQLVVAGKVLRAGNTLLRPPERLLADAEHRTRDEQGRANAGRVWELVEILERRSPSMVMSA